MKQATQRLRSRFRRPVRFGSLRRTTPISDHWGFDRGTPIDRYYIEAFLERYRADIRGIVLEVQDSGYTRHFGTGVSRAEVLDIDPSNSNATVTVDLTDVTALEQAVFDCFILTQTLHLIYDVRAAISGARALLRPGGVLLATLPSLSRIDFNYPGDFWRFTPAACVRLFGEAFSVENVSVTPYGNVLSAVAFLMGIAREDLSERELDVRDERFPVLIGVRAIRG